MNAAQFAVSVLRSAQFMKTCISQGSVATRLRCDGIAGGVFIANCPQSVLVKEF